MTFYRYEALDRNGSPVSGVLSGADQQAVVQRLSSMGFSVQRICPAPGQRADNTPSAAVQPAQYDLPVSLPSSVPLRSMAAFLRRMATSIRAGIGVGQMVSDLAGTASTGKLRRAARDLSDRMTLGARLGEAMYAQPRIFPAHVAGLVLAGEIGGFLDIALDEAASGAEQEFKDRLVGWFIRLIWWGILIPLPFLLPIFKLGSILQQAGEGMVRNEGLDFSGRIGLILNAYLHEFYRVGNKRRYRVNAVYNAFFTAGQVDYERLFPCA